MTLENSHPGWYLIREGTPSDLLDGDHSGIEGVVKAARLHEGIFSDAGPWQALHLKTDGTFDVRDLPAVEVDIDEDRVRICADLVSNHHPSIRR